MLFAGPNIMVNTIILALPSLVRDSCMINPSNAVCCSISYVPNRTEAREWHKVQHSRAGIKSHSICNLYSNYCAMILSTISSLAG